MPPPLSISGYVLAGGRSSRMGCDKALLPLAGRPLIDHAVAKLRRVCTEVYILSNDRDLSVFAPVVPDIHPRCGPIGGIEAALMHTSREWNLFLPVDVPLLPAAVLSNWVGQAMLYRPGICIFSADGRPQPGICLVHRAIATLVSRAIAREEFALMPLFEEVGRETGYSFAAMPAPDLGQLSKTGGVDNRELTPAQLVSRPFWFLNLNTRADLALAETQLAALDT